jgi:hypothetical protein
MLSHHQTLGGVSDPRFLVTTTHVDGVTCHHTGATRAELDAFVAEHAEAGDTTQYFEVAPGRIDGIHWQLVA